MLFQDFKRSCPLIGVLALLLAAREIISLVQAQVYLVADLKCNRSALLVIGHLGLRCCPCYGCLGFILVEFAGELEIVIFFQRLKQV